MVFATIILPQNTIINLHGNVINIDFMEKWSSIDPFSEIVYLIGDVLCHQDFDRSFIISGNQMPICSRDFCALIGLICGMFYSIKIGIKDEKMFKTLFVVSFVLLIIDVAIQNIFSLNILFTRIITGTFVGIVIGIAIDRAIKLNYG